MKNNQLNNNDFSSELVGNFLGDLLFEEDTNQLKEFILELDDKNRNYFVDYIKNFIADMKKKLCSTGDMPQEIIDLEIRVNNVLKEIGYTTNGKIKSNTPKPKNKFCLNVKKVFFNILGFYIGYYLGYFATLIAKYIFIDLLGNIGFLTAILSWPVEYETYALTGVIFTDAFASLSSCAFISRLGKAKINYSCIVLGLFRIITYILSLISTISSSGFSLSFVWTMLICLIGFIYMTFVTANNSEL